jgi:hypothetical protein
VERYPLSWPAGWKRTAPSARRRGRFGKRKAQQQGGYAYLQDIQVGEAVLRVLEQLGMLGVPQGDAIISTNLPTRLDGLPRAGAAEPADPGAAVYWQLGGRRECMAIDLYTRAADNLAAIAATLEAMRAIERHGGVQILERAFAGFAALPETTSGKSWRDVLNFHPAHVPTSCEIRDRYRQMAKLRHPDAGGSEESWHELQWALEAALADVGGAA